VVVGKGLSAFWRDCEWIRDLNPGCGSAKVFSDALRLLSTVIEKGFLEHTLLTGNDQKEGGYGYYSKGYFEKERKRDLERLSRGNSL
jgi:hypothetical protein